MVKDDQKFKIGTMDVWNFQPEGQQHAVMSGRGSNLGKNSTDPANLSSALGRINSRGRNAEQAADDIYSGVGSEVVKTHLSRGNSRGKSRESGNGK